MPRINNTPPLPTKNNFKKKNYRPWNLLDDDFRENGNTHNSNEVMNKPETDNSKSDAVQETTNIKKVVSNQYQSDTKTDIKVVPNQYQSDTNKLQNWYQSGNRTDTKTDIKAVPNQYQSDTKTGFFSLIGLQKEITLSIYTLCQLSRDRKTDAVSINQLANQCKSTVGAVKIAVYRLIEKNILVRESFKNGRGGWTVYSLPNNIYQEILNMEAQTKLLSNRYQSGTKLVTELVSEVIPSASSSGNNTITNNKTTTTGEMENSVNPNTTLTGEWLDIDIEPLNSIGFTQTHLVQIASQNKLQPKIVQDSIYAFAFDLEKNDRAKTIKGDHINFFMGILRNGKPYAPSSNYESPQDKAMRIYLEKMRQIEQKRAAEEKEAFDLAFKDWFSKLSAEQKREFLPEMLRRNANVETSKMLESNARSHFEKEIWALNKAKIILEE